jgi:hypothetical protein
MLARVYDPALKAQGIGTLFEFQVERGDGPDPELFESMLSRVLEVPDEGQRANVLARMAVIHIKAGLDADLPRYVEAVEGAVPRNMIRLRMAEALGDAGRFEEAESVLKVILAPQQQAPVHDRSAEGGGRGLGVCPPQRIGRSGRAQRCPDGAD